MTISQDYHIQIGVRNVNHQNIQPYLLDVWQRALTDLGIPLVPALARCYTRNVGISQYHQIIYGISSSVVPDSDAILDSVVRVLASDGQSLVGVRVEVFLVARRLAGQAKRGWEALTI